jgi:hypothetical protein
MAQTLQGALQAQIRAVTNTSLSYEGDWHTYLTSKSIALGQWDARMIAYAITKGLVNPTASAAHNYFLLSGTI